MRILNLFFTMGLIALLFSNCEKSKQPVSVRYSRTFPIDTAIKVDSLYGIKDSYVPGRLFRIGNRLIVRGDYNMFYIYSYPQLDLLRKQEITRSYASATSDGSKIYFETKGDVDVYSLNENDSLCALSSFTIAKAPITIGAVQRLDSNVYIYSDKYDFRGLNEFHIVDIGKKQRLSKGDYPEDATRFKKLEDFKTAYMHSLLVKPDKSAFVVVYSQLKRVRIYEKEGELLHDISLDYSPGNYAVMPEEYEKRYWHFGQFFTTDKYIYILNPDKLGMAPTKPKCNIIVMDWQGKLVARYRLNVWVHDFFVDEPNNMLFGSCWHRSAGSVFFTLNLDELL